MSLNAIRLFFSGLLSVLLPGLALAEDIIVVVRSESSFEFSRSKKGTTIPYVMHVREVHRIRLSAAALPWPEENNTIQYDSADCSNLKITVNAYDAKGRQTRIRKLTPYRPAGKSGFASDLRGFRYFVPGLEPGAEIEEIIEYDDYTLMSASKVRIRSTAKVEQTHVRIVYPSDLDLAIHPFHIGSDFTVTREDGSERVFDLVNKQPLAQQPYNGDDTEDLYQPWLLMMVRGYQTSEGFKPLFDTPEHLRDWYRRRYDAQYRPGWDSLPQAFVDSLYAGAKTTDEKLRRAFTWVQTNIKYVAFLEGDEGWIPHSPVRVYNQRFGDCKGMSSLLHCLVQKAGIASSLALVGTRDIIFNPDSFPTPRCFNHMIALAYPEKDKPPVVLDGTNSLMLVGQTPEAIQGKTALAITGPRLLEHLPEMEDVYSGIRDSIYAHIEGTSLIYNVTTEYLGYSKNINYLLTEAQTEEQRLKWMQQAMMGSETSASCKILSLQMNERNEKPVRLKYTLTIPNAVTRLGGKMYLNPWKPLSSSKGLFASNIPEDRLAPFSTDYRSQVRQYLQLTLPDGYRLVTTPEKKHIEQPGIFDFHYSIAAEGGKVLMSNTFRQQAFYIMPSVFTSYRKAFSDLKQIIGASLVLQSTAP